MSRTLSLQRSKKLLEEQGYATWIVEKPYNPYTKRREDLFNFIDLVGIRADLQGVLGIQATGSDVTSHIHKVLEGFEDNRGKRIPPNPYVATWLKSGNRAFIWSWRLRKHKGTKDTWQLRQIQFILKDGQVTANEIKHDAEQRND